MSESAALQSWRRRALGTGGDRPHPPVRAVAAAALAVACAFGGSRVLNHNTTAKIPDATVEQSHCPAIDSAIHADIDGDGCDEAVSYADGILTAGSRQLRVGLPGDQIALGRWTCGPVTAALLRPSTGEVFRFDRWAVEGNTVSAAAVTRIEGAVGMHAAPRPGGRCDDLAVDRRSGPPVLVPERPVAG